MLSVPSVTVDSFLKRIFAFQITNNRFLTKILDQNALEYLAFGKDFIGDRIGDARNLNQNLENNL